MFRRIRNRHLFLLDVFLLPLAVYFSYVLRLEGLDIAPFWGSFVLFVFFALIITPTLFRWVGIYARFWLYASVEELLLLAGALTLSAVICGLLNLTLASVYPLVVPFPRSTPFIFLLLSIAFTAAPRLLLRLAALYQRPDTLGMRGLQHVLVVGAGDAGAKILREIQHTGHLGYHIIGLVDDDPLKKGMQLHGVPVLGGRQDIPLLVEEYGIQQVIIAMPSAAGVEIREIVRICEQAKVKTQIVPSLSSLIDGRVTINQLRNVEIEDLLRREAVKTDTTAVHHLLRGKRILITGAGGSIGSELCRQVLQCAPAELILLGHGENSIFGITHELRRLNAYIPITAVIADVRFPQRLHALFEQHRPQIVFHAAAHKHVPLMEANPTEAITNNVQGTRNLLRAAQDAAVEHFVMISTDKAVNPTSIMGASKRLAEMLVLQAAQQTGRPYQVVRFGNVLGSRGSVVLTFKEQIARGGPVTITHPDITRFFMTIPEAVQLVLQAAVLGRGGEIFVLDMGQPIKIVDLAHDLITLSGLEVGRDIEIVYSGLRPGEKLYEELFNTGEIYDRTEHHKIFLAINASTLLPSALNEQIEALITAAINNDPAALYHCLQQLIPDNELAPFVRPS